MTKQRIGLLVAGVLLTTQVVAQLSETGVLIDRIVAIVNDGVVLQSELDYQLDNVTRGLTAQGVALPPVDILRSQVLESLVLKRIQLQRVEMLGLEVSDEEVNRSLEMLARRGGLTLSELPAALTLQGLDYGRYREEVREEMVLDQLRMRDVASRISITRAEVDQMLAKSAPEDVEYEVLHMLIATPTGASETQIQETAAEANELYERLQAGEEFGPLAVAYSDTPGVLQNRGNLGYRKASELPSIFAELVPKMEAGATSPPIQTSGGFHIIKLNDIRGAEKVITTQRRARHILIQTNEIVDDTMARNKLDKVLAQIRDGADFATLAESESDDAASAKQGGDLGWVNPGSFAPAFEAQLDAMEPGQLSEPFQTQFGWHIVELLETRTHDSTLDVRRNKAAANLRTRKFEEQSQTWIRQLRDEAYVEIKLDSAS